MITKDTKNEIFVLMLPGDRKLKIKKIEKILGGNRIKLMEKSEIEDE
jgi:prolyl-tRNA editing enzyme YbaK/EbsC (Cys-tRNA(Pro) deacylase)